MEDTEGNGVSATDLQTELRNNGYTNAEVIGNQDGSLTVKFESGKIYTIDSNGNITGPTNGEKTPPTTGKTDGSYDANKGVNTPKIDEEKGMQLVKYDEGTQTWVEDTTKSEYSYEEQTGTTASSAYKYGDATYETSGWNGASASFVNSYAPFFLHGGFFFNASDAGGFCFDLSNGDSYSDFGFRVCLVVQ